MRRLLLAIQGFFRILFDAELAEDIRRSLTGETAATLPAVETKPKPEKPAAAPRPARSDALTLLATLQREARFVDFVQEPLGEYSDAQIAAAARDVHRDCAAAIERMFALRPVLEGEEGSEVTVPEDFDAGRYRLTGNVTDESQPRGKLAHHGWEASKCEVPTWTGGDGAARVVAPAEVEVP